MFVLGTIFKISHTLISSHRTDKHLYNLIDKYIVHQNLDTKTIFDMLEKFRGLDVDWRLHLMLLLLLPFAFPPIFVGCKQDSAKFLFCFLDLFSLLETGAFAFPVLANPLSS